MLHRFVPCLTLNGWGGVGGSDWRYMLMLASVVKNHLAPNILTHQEGAESLDACPGLAAFFNLKKK